MGLHQEGRWQEKVLLPAVGLLDKPSGDRKACFCCSPGLVLMCLLETCRKDSLGCGTTAAAFTSRLPWPDEAFPHALVSRGTSELNQEVILQQEEAGSFCPHYIIQTLFCCSRLLETEVGWKGSFGCSGGHSSSTASLAGSHSTPVKNHFSKATDMVKVL